MSFTIRPYRGADEGALLGLWNMALASDPITPALFHTKVLLDPNFNPDLLLLAESGGALAGFVLGIARQVPLFLEGLQPEVAWVTAFGVHPAFRRQGAAAALFETLAAGLRAESRHVLRISPYVPNYFTPGVDRDAYPAAVQFLGKLGFAVTSEPVSMQLDLTGFRVPPEIETLEHRLSTQASITIGPLQSSDLPELMPFIARHFGWEWWRHAQEYLLELLGPGSDQVVFWVARRGVELLGYCQMRRERFGPFGVLPELRGQGIGRVLLVRCLASIRARGFHSAWFLWAEPEVQKLYRRLGFQVVRRWIIFEKSLP